MKTPGTLSCLHFGTRVLRCAVYALILSICLPVPGAFAPVSAKAEGHDVTDVLHRLNSPDLISITNSTNGGNFISGPNYYSTASLTARVVDADGVPVNGATVTWTVQTAQNNSQAMMPRWKSKKTGLTWGATPEANLTYAELDEERIADTTSATNASGEAAIQLTDIVGERVITVEAEVTISGTTYSVTRDVSFGRGPLAMFKMPARESNTWDKAYAACNGTAYPNPDHTSGWTSGTYVGGGKMPTRAEMHTVSPYYTGGVADNPNTNSQGAAIAAGWPYGYYWTGEAFGADNAFLVYLDDGDDIGYVVSYRLRVACRR